MIRIPWLLMIADDLTGALDSAVAFRARGLGCRVATHPEALPEAMSSGAEVVAVATGTRELTSRNAAEVLGGIASRLKAWNGIVFKKIDSRMKGNIGVEIGALTDVLGRPVFVCPAVPRLGRFVRAGAVCGEGVAEPIAIAPRIMHPARIVDAERLEDIRYALPGDPSKTLLVGAAGLAEALAEQLVPVPGALPAVQALPLPGFLAIGSRDPVTLEQVAALQFEMVRAPNGVVPAVQPSQLCGVQLTPGDLEISGIEAAERFAQGVAREVRRLNPRTLFACGGETARSILDVHDIHQLDVEAEISPGMPLSRCPFTGLRVVTKSGGFGSPDILVNLADKFANSSVTR
jgi:D-threonate/D-erythronate kinase